MPSERLIYVTYTNRLMGGLGNGDLVTLDQFRPRHYSFYGVEIGTKTIGILKNMNLGIGFTYRPMPMLCMWLYAKILEFFYATIFWMRRHLAVHIHFISFSLLIYSAVLLHH